VRVLHKAPAVGGVSVPVAHPHSHALKSLALRGQRSDVRCAAPRLLGFPLLIKLLSSLMPNTGAESFSIRSLAQVIRHRSQSRARFVRICTSGPDPPRTTSL